MFRSGGTDNPLMVDVVLCRRINQKLGGAVFKPWEIGEIDQDWLDAIENLEKPSVLNRSWEKVNEKFAEFRSKYGRT